jgi:outer membrane protein assembly factor BamB
MERNTRACWIASVLLAGLLLTLTGIGRATSWSRFHGDARQSGLSTADAPYDSLLAWTYATGDSIVYSSPVVAADGTIYIGNVEKELLAFTPQGNLDWSFRGEGNFRHSTPAIAPDGTIYIGGNDGRLYAINPDSTRKWTFVADAPIKTSPNIAADGTIYFGADDGQLYAIHPDSTLAWTYATGDTIRSSPAIGPDGTIFFGSTDFYFYALWPDGSLRWRAATGGQIKYCSPAVTEDGVVYFGSYDGFVYALTSDQTFLWAYPTGRYFGDDDVLCVGSDDGALHCVHADGTGDWTFTVGVPIRSSPAPSDDGNVYVADLEGRFWAFGRLSGVSVDESEMAAERWVVALPSVTSGRVRFHVGDHAAQAARIVIRDVLGRDIADLRLAAGAASWDGRDASGQRVPAGVYYYAVDGRGPTGRVVLIR